MSHRLRVLAFLLALSFCAPALAQETGGSFGGGDFGSSGTESTGGGTDYGGGGGDWNSGSNTSDNNWGGGTTPNYGSSTGGGSVGCVEGAGGLCCLLVFVGIVGFALVMRGKKGGGGPMQSGPNGGLGGPATYHGPNAMHVSQLSVGIDWRARKELQATLTRLASTGDTKSKQGLAALLRETVLALRRNELSWLYVAHKTLGPFAPPTAEGQFQQLATAARAAFKHELVRGAGGQVQTSDTPNVEAKSNEGEGTVVVHIVIAARRALSSLANPDANQIRMALDNRAALTADQLVALEVVWSPAAENDRMSSAELEQFYPDMRLIDPNSIAGRIFCTYCRGPFAMELLSCPHCGAPAEASKDNRAPH